MKKRKRRKNKEQIIRYEGFNISQERMIEIQAEAYYRAIKRVESEKKEQEEKKLEKKYKWYENVLFVLNVVLWPWKISKRFSINARIHESVLVLFVSGALKIVGGCMWLSGIVNTVYGIWKGAVSDGLDGIIKESPIMVFMLLLGSVFVLAGETFGKETDSNKIYAYSGSIIALISCVVSIMALVGV